MRFSIAKGKYMFKCRPMAQCIWAFDFITVFPCLMLLEVAGSIPEAANN